MKLNDTSRRRPMGGRRVPHGLRLELALLALLLCSLTPLYSQEAPAAQAASGEQTPIGQADPAVPGAGRVALVSTWDFVRMVLVLAIVVGLIYAVFLVVRKSGRRAEAPSDLITVLGSRTLSGNRGLHLVRVGKSVYLVGSSESSVGLVSEITDKESVDELSLAASRQVPAGKRTFSDILGGLLPQIGSGGRMALPEGLGFLRRQRERLRKIGGV